MSNFHYWLSVVASVIGTVAAVLGDVEGMTALWAVAATNAAWSLRS